MEELRLWIMPICALISAVAAVSVWLTGPFKRVNSVERRLDIVELELRHLPDADDIADIKQQLGRADARLESLDRETQSINRALTRVENHLLGASP